VGRQGAHRSLENGPAPLALRTISLIPRSRLSFAMRPPSREPAARAWSGVTRRRMSSRSGSVRSLL